MSSFRIETLSVGSSTVWYAKGFSAPGTLAYTYLKERPDGSLALNPGISADTYIFKRFRKANLRSSIPRSQDIASGRLWFSTPELWRQDDPWEAAVVPEFLSLHPSDGRADTACCSWSLCPDSTGERLDLGSVELFRQYAGSDGCIVAATLGNVLRALASTKKDTKIPEARVILWIEELVRAQAATPGYFGDGGDPAYTGWPLVYKHGERFAEEREIRFVLKNQDGTYLKIPTSMDCEKRKELQRQPFKWGELQFTLYAPIEKQSFYLSLLEQRKLDRRVLPLKGSLWGRHPEARDPAESTEQPAPLTPDLCSGRVWRSP